MKTTNDHPGALGGLGRRLGRPRHLIFAALVAVCVALPAATSSAAPALTLPAPGGLQTFMTDIGEASSCPHSIPEFARTPAFAWAPVKGAQHYEFELSTSSPSASNGSLAENGVIWSSDTLTTPATAIPLSLPWITGQPNSLYWHVRAVAGDSVSQWSAPKGFNMGWCSVPQKITTHRPGYVRWTTVDGATGYQVWFLDNAHKVISTITNVADEREYYTFRDPAMARDVHWRVRAVRAAYGHAQNALPAVSHGPWSPVFHSTNPTAPLDARQDVTPIATVSGAIAGPLRTKTIAGVPQHALMPAFLFAGNGDDMLYGLHRIYVFSDRDCVNVVYRGAIVGGPAYAPRTSGPLALPQTKQALQTQEVLQSRGAGFLGNGSEGNTYALDNTRDRTTEAAAVSTASTVPGAKPTSGGPRTVDLWDRSLPGGRYYWTVVPVQAVVNPSNQKVSYHETELPQDACQGRTASGAKEAPRMLTFGKHSNGPSPTGSRSVPYATGLSPTGRLLSAATSNPAFYGYPLVAWSAAPAASRYDVQWSKTRYPWRPAGHLSTPATSAVLSLTPGQWWYRVRGVNAGIPGNQKMQWSASARLEITKPTLGVVGG